MQKLLIKLQKTLFYADRANAAEQPKDANANFEKALLYAEESQEDSLYLATFQKKVHYYFFHGDYQQTINLAQSLLHLSEEKNDLFFQYRAKTYLANGNKMLVLENEALRNYREALDLTKQMGDSLLIGDAYNNLGDAYMTLERFEEAEEYFKVALSIYDAINTDESEKYITYKNLARVVDGKEQTQYYLEKALHIVKDENNPYKLSLFYLTSGDAYTNKKMYPQAVEALDKSYQLADSINYTVVKNISMVAAARAHYYLKNYEKSIEYGQLALKDTAIAPKNKHHTLFSLYQSYAGIGDYKNAFEYAEAAFDLQDSLNINEANANYAEYDARFNAEQKDKEIAQQQLQLAKEKNTRNLWIFGSLAALLVGFGVFQWRNQWQKRRKIAIEAELQKEQEINDLRSKFLGNIAHEIRTPLTLISGNLKLALEQLSHPEKAKKNLEIALQNSTKVTEDANEILELLKFEKDKTKIHTKLIVLKNTVSRIVLSFGSLAEMKNINFHFQNDIPANYHTKIDVDKTEKIINNLISNALKYSPAESTVEVSAHLEKEQLLLSVTDQGQGIHYDETEKIFERFYQAQNAQSVGGIGIGLSLSREFAHLLGGSLEVESTLGKGSTFQLIMPVPKSNEIPESIETITEKLVEKKIKDIPSEATKTNLQQSRILIVEDHPQMAQFLQEILSPHYHCTIAFDGMEALERIEKEHFDLITSDIMMPRLDGFQFREKVNALPKYRHIPFILISAKTLEEDKIRGFTLGVDDYIVKPFNKEELLARVQNLLRNYQAREQWKLEHKNLVSETISADEKLLQEIEATILENLNRDDFTIQQLAEGVNYSQRQLTRILKQYTGMTPVQFLLEVRLQKAYQLLQHKTFFTLSEVRYDVGISSSTYFNKKFKERFGVAPASLLS